MGDTRLAGAVSLWKLVGYFLTLHQQGFYGETVIRWRNGQPHGLVATHQNAVVDDLPNPTEEQITAFVQKIAEDR